MNKVSGRGYSRVCGGRSFNCIEEIGVLLIVGVA